MNKEELFYHETTRRTQEQYASRQHFDTMSTAVLGLGSVILSAMVFTVPYWSKCSIFPASVVIGSFLILAISAVWGLMIREWKFKPKLDMLKANVEAGYEDKDIIKFTADAMSAGVGINEAKLRAKAIRLGVSYGALVLQVIALAFLILSLTMNHR